MYVNLQDVIDILNRYGQALSDPPMDMEEVVELKLIHKLREAICTEVKIKDVAPIVHGKWEYDRWCEFKCSICGEWSNTLPRAREEFCPNCGARMDGGNSNE